MLATLSGSVTLVKLLKEEKALFPMMVTGRPLIFLGMTTELSVPV